MPLDADLAAYGKQIVRVGIFLKVASTPAIRVWAGVGKFRAPPSAIELGGEIYLGMGTLVGVPSVSALINGLAQRVEFTLAGVTAEILALADEEADVVRSAQVNLGIIGFDRYWQPIGTHRWLWEGEADSPRVQHTGGQDGSASRTIGLSVGSAFTGRRRPPRLSFYTDPDQRSRSPTDRSCEHVNRYAEGTTVRWPKPYN